MGQVTCLYVCLGLFLVAKPLVGATDHIAALKMPSSVATGSAHLQATERRNPARVWILPVLVVRDQARFSLNSPNHVTSYYLFSGERELTGGLPW